jgi:hypothetical protein
MSLRGWVILLLLALAVGEAALIKYQDKTIHLLLTGDEDGPSVGITPADAANCEEPGAVCYLHI